MSNRQRLSLHRLVTLILLVAITGCGLIDSGNTDCETNPAAAWRASLPLSATNVQERCSMNIVNPSYTATFLMSPDDLETFQQSTLIRDWMADASAAGVFESEAAQMESFLVGTYGDGAVALEVLIDTSDPQQYHVYYDATYVD